VAGVPDRVAPLLSGLRAVRTRGRLALSFDLSEPAVASGRLDRIRPGANDAPGRPITSRRLEPGQARIGLRSLARGPYRLRLVVRDATGNSRSIVRVVRVA
jgi:hypothetical protein